MIKSKQANASKLLTEVVVRGMQERKAMDIVVMDLQQVKNAVADFFVICSGNSDKHLAAIAQSVDDEVYKILKEDPWSKEGKHNKEWMLLDYVTVVVHIFKKDKREFFSLEKLWGDAVLTEIKNIEMPKEEKVDKDEKKIREFRRPLVTNEIERPKESIEMVLTPSITEPSVIKMTSKAVLPKEVIEKAPAGKVIEMKVKPVRVNEKEGLKKPVKAKRVAAPKKKIKAVKVVKAVKTKELPKTKKAVVIKKAKKVKPVKKVMAAKPETKLKKVKAVKVVKKKSK